MGNYGGTGKDKKPMATFYTSEGIEDFGAMFIEAAEIEYVDLQKMRKMAERVSYPVTFFLINATYNQVLKNMQDRMPEFLPVVKEYASKEKTKKQKE
jgi:hypothetical protein